MIMPTLYVVQTMLVSLMLMMIGASYPRLTGLSFSARSLLGLTLTPPALGLFTLAIAFVWPGAPRVAFFLVPMALAIAALTAMRSHFARVMADGRAFIVSVRGLRHRRWAIWVCCLALLVFVLSAIGATFGAPIGHDALVYLTEARVFAEARTIASIPSFDAAIGHVVKTHPHLFLWQAYLAQGLMATDGSLGYQHDYFARFAIQATFALLPISTLIVARAATPAWTNWLAPAILLTFGNIEYITRNFSVDGFRIITYLAFVALLLSCLRARHRLNLGRIVTIGAVCGVAAAAHTLDVVFVGLAGVSFLLLALVRLIAWRNLFAIGIACAAFLIPVATPYVQNWLVYGSILGEGMAYIGYRDTPLWNAFEHQRHWTQITGVAEAFLLFAWQYRFVPMLLAAVSAVGTVVMAIKRPAMWQMTGLSVVFLVALIVPLLSVGHDVSLQGAMLSNLRYGLLICALAAPLIAAFAAPVYRQITPLIMCNRWFVPTMAGVCTILIVAASTWVMFWSLETAVFAQSYLKDNEIFVAAAVEKLPFGTNWATDRYTPTYFVSRPPLFLYAQAAHPLLAARTEDDVLGFLVRNKICLVALYNHDSDWWPMTEFYQVIRRLHGTKMIVHRNWSLYFLPDIRAGEIHIPSSAIGCALNQSVSKMTMSQNK